MSLIKLSNNGVKNVSSLSGLTSSVGDLVFISKATASASTSAEFTLTSSYKEFIFYFVNIHPSSDGANFTFNLSTDSGSNYNVTKTTTGFLARHSESGTGGDLQYKTGEDLAQSTSDQIIGIEVGADADQNLNGELKLFNPNSNIFVKHFISTTNGNDAHSDFNYNLFVSGYCNTTSPITNVIFRPSSGNFDGQILMFGVN
jgi:hypothetical protein